ncbi:hypothetical protein NARSGI1_01460 [endosymbiont of Sipalinus gigas]|uniref:hypothetical protein n=1 Tax=endosymbiont of Sipalinus gigas TaxID=1972134 RepID=UPI000DC72CE1|nr:hypothetical protein [endosymbiont of Sipalinus gigas]BBA85291.1 hypothetical protein NARSGI1_01460 [endosymbiont of Sipalinus gigas]
MINNKKNKFLIYKNFIKLNVIFLSILLMSFFGFMFNKKIIKYIIMLNNDIFILNLKKVDKIKINEFIKFNDYYKIPSIKNDYNVDNLVSKDITFPPHLNHLNDIK